MTEYQGAFSVASTYGYTGATILGQQQLILHYKHPNKVNETKTHSFGATKTTRATYISV